METFFSFWYRRAPRRLYETCRQVILSFDATLAVRTTIQNLTRPLFQDYSWQGRVIGFFFRIGRITAAFFIYALISLLFAVACAVWLAFPAISLLNIVGFIASR